MSAVAVLLTVFLAAAASPQSAGAPTPQRRGDSPAVASTVEQVLDRAAQALATYAEQLSLVIGVEHYVQCMTDATFRVAHKRSLVSEFALVRVKDDWAGFRDVYDVDGESVRDRQDRLASLFLDRSPDTLPQAKRITDESARHNLGSVRRNFNVPTMALFFLQPSAVDRFRFRKDGAKTCR